MALLVIVAKKSKRVQDKGSELGFGFKISVRGRVRVE